MLNMNKKLEQREKLTTDNPVSDVERTRRTPFTPFKAVSIGYDTSFSTSSGAIPGASVITVTVGAFKSGKTSTVVLETVYNPADTISANTLIIK